MDGCNCNEFSYAASITYMVGEYNEKETVIFSVACVSCSAA